MSVASRNQFALLNDEEEPVAPVAAAPAPAAQQAAAPKNDRPTRGRGRGGRTNGHRDAVKNEDGFSTANPNEPGQHFERNTATRGGRAGRAGGRGGRGRGGQRFDRHSQTGHTDSAKAVDQGWGAETGQAELSAEAQGEADAKVEEKADKLGVDVPASGNTDGWELPPTTAGDEAAPAPAVAGEEIKVPEEEVDNTLSYEDYLKQQKVKDAGALPPKLEGRQVGEDSGQWKSGVELLREETEDVYFAGKGKNVPREKARKEKQILETDFSFERAQRGRGDFRGGRGGRGGDRGGDRGGRGFRGNGRGSGFRGDSRASGRGRGGTRGGGAGSSAVALDDDSAFPSLG